MKVLVTGSFDLLHSGHIAFLKTAYHYGDVYVGIGSDKSIEALKDRKTINPQDERLYMVKAIRYVTDAWINSGTGENDFFLDIEKSQIDMLIVNEDQNNNDKRLFCKRMEIVYLVLKRIPEPGLPIRSTTALIESKHTETVELALDIVSSIANTISGNRKLDGSIK